MEPTPFCTFPGWEIETSHCTDMDGKVITDIADGAWTPEYAIHKVHKKLKPEGEAKTHPLRRTGFEFESNRFYDRPATPFYRSLYGRLAGKHCSQFGRAFVQCAATAGARLQVQQCAATAQLPAHSGCSLLQAHPWAHRSRRRE